MKKISLLSIITLFTFVLTLQSCGGGGGDDGGGTPTADTTKPVIKESSFTPANNTEFTIGSSSIVVNAEVSDNVALGSYKIDIHNDFDGHGSHTKAFEASNTERSIEYTPFAAVRTGNLSGVTASINVSIEIPDFSSEGKRYQAGKYHLVLYVFDAAGNETVSYRDIVLN